MIPSQALAPRSSATLDTVQEILGALVARYRRDEVLTSVRQIPAREAKFRPRQSLWLSLARPRCPISWGTFLFAAHQ
jgi:hypothetical protein